MFLNLPSTLDLSLASLSATAFCSSSADISPARDWTRRLAELCSS